MKQIHAFWKGPTNDIQKQIDSLEKQGFRVNLGPSDSEHKYLSDNYSYYKQAYENKIWSFCSDVWRFYTLSKKPGLYIDIKETIGDNFNSLYSEIENDEVSLVRGSSHNIGSSFLYSNGSKNAKDFFKKCLDVYKKYTGSFVRTFPVGPHVVTWVARKYNSPGFYEIKKDFVKIRPFTFIRDETKYKKIGNASWSGGFNPAVYSQGVEENFSVRHKLDTKQESKYYWSELFPEVDIFGLRDEYDKANNKKQLRHLKKTYKSFSGKIYFKERLIWSILYRLFTLKRAK